MTNKQLLKLLRNPLKFNVNKLPPRTSLTSSSNFNINLNGEYDFNFYNNLLDRNQNFHLSKDYISSTIIVPSNIELNGYGQIQYVNFQYPWDGTEDIKYGDTPLKTNYCGQYCKRFKIDYIRDNCRYILSFQGVEGSFNVWINGAYIGYSEDSFTTAEFDISKTINVGTNIISIEVYKFSSTSFLNCQDFWRLSGIIRDVSILEEYKDSIQDFKIEYNICKNYTNVQGNITLFGDLTSETCLEIYYKNALINKFSTNGKLLKFYVENAALWSAELPNLYNFVLKNKNTTISKIIGFREIKIHDSILKINGKRLIFKGINRHEFDSNVGRALTYNEIYKDLKIIKDSNFNAIRTSHYPNNNIFYEICNELGLYVIDEANLETHATWINKNNESFLPDKNQLYYNVVRSRIMNMYQRDKNNTSVIIWSLGNESHGGIILKKIYDELKIIDQYRPIQYEGIFLDRIIPEISDIESQMYTSSEDISKYLENNNDKPFILCEYSHAMGNSLGNITDYIALEEKYKSYQGGFIWKFADQAIFDDGIFKYGGYFNDYPNDNSSICDGLLGPGRTTTDELLYVKNLFSPLKITEDENSLFVYNTNLFKSYYNVEVILHKSEIHKKTVIYSSYENFEIDSIIEFAKEISKGNYIIEFYEKGNLLKSYSYQVESLLEIQQKTQEGEYIDGVLNFGIMGDDFKVLFSKISNNISVLEYNGQNLFSDPYNTIIPNFWRAPTEKDKGYNMHKKLAKCRNLTYYSIAKIEKYSYENSILNVYISFTNFTFTEYISIIHYKVFSNGDIDVSLHSQNVGQVFNFGVLMSLSNKIYQYAYLGNGPYSSYIDRSEGLVRDYYSCIVGEDKRYLVPQEYGNKTNVSNIELRSRNGITYSIFLDKGEFSLKNHSDKQLEECKNDAFLVNENPFFRLNKFQTGVGGDDSWTTWVKEKYTFEVIDEIFTFKIKR